MPEYPDIVLYIEALEKRIQNETLDRVSITSPFLLRTATPPLSAAEGKRVLQLQRQGKRICIGLEGDLWLVLHLMIAGRLHWHEGKIGGSKKQRLATFYFSSGALSLTEAGSERRAAVHLVAGEKSLKELDSGGLDVLEINLERFAKALQSSNHTLKRALTDPKLFSGIGNAYSDEILFVAQLSPIKLTQKLSADEIERLFIATRTTLLEWVERLRRDAGENFPEKVTAFRPAMAVHGRYKLPCPRCGSRIARIRYSSNETNYCPKCQTGGRLLADRSLSRLLRADWPR